MAGTSPKNFSENLFAPNINKTQILPKYQFSAILGIFMSFYVICVFFGPLCSNIFGLWAPSNCTRGVMGPNILDPSDPGRSEKLSKICKNRKKINKNTRILNQFFRLVGSRLVCLLDN